MFSLGPRLRAGDGGGGPWALGGLQEFIFDPSHPAELAAELAGPLLAIRTRTPVGRLTTGRFDRTLSKRV